MNNNDWDITTYKMLENNFTWEDVVSAGKKIKFINGSWASIIGKNGYGDGINYFEIMSSSTRKTRNIVKGWRTKKQIMSHLKYISKLGNF